MSNDIFGSPDVIVVGAGNAASCAALSVREKGASSIMLEAAPIEDSGGNSRYTAGLMRAVFHGVDDLVQIIPEGSVDMFWPRNGSGLGLGLKDSALRSS